MYKNSVGGGNKLKFCKPTIRLNFYPNIITNSLKPSLSSKYVIDAYIDLNQ